MLGLSLENFDGVGAYRTQENGVPIDASGELDGTKFDDPVSLGRAVRDNSAVPACLVKRASEYALRRPLNEGEAGWVKDLTSRFTSDGYRLRSLLRAIATSDTFFPVSSGASVPPVSRHHRANAFANSVLPAPPGPCRTTTLCSRAATSSW